MSEAVKELDKEVKVAIISQNLTACQQQIYDLTINIEVNKIAGDDKAIDRQKEVLAVWMKKRDAFAKMLTELGGDNGNP